MISMKTLRNAQIFLLTLSKNTKKDPYGIHMLMILISGLTSRLSGNFYNYFGKTSFRHFKVECSPLKGKEHKDSLNSFTPR